MVTRLAQQLGNLTVDPGSFAFSAFPTSAFRKYLPPQSQNIYTNLHLKKRARRPTYLWASLYIYIHIIHIHICIFNQEVFISNIPSSILCLICQTWKSCPPLDHSLTVKWITMIDLKANTSYPLRLCILQYKQNWDSIYQRRRIKWLLDQ